MKNLPLILVVFLLLTIRGSSAVFAFSGEGAGTEASPYVITDVTQLQEMNLDLSAHYVLGNDIDASETEGWNEGQGFEPIGSVEPRFEGCFDGHGYIISDLHIDRPNTNDVGLFGSVNGASVQNVVIASSYFQAKSFSGGLIGSAINGSKISNCSANVQVDGVGCLGGLVGIIDTGVTILNSSASGPVTGRYRSVVSSAGGIGGLIGCMSSSKILSCSASGAVYGDNAVGGLIGDTYGSEISNCFSNGDVSGSSPRFNFLGASQLGGLIGSHRYSILRDSYATGTIGGYTLVGGLVGDNYQSVISGSFTDCFVNAERRTVGGLVGWSWGSSIISGCYSRSEVHAGSLVGGLVGDNQYGSIISNSYSVGLVAGIGSSVGGLVGRDTTGLVTNSFWDVEASGQPSSDGGQGQATIELYHQGTFRNWNFQSLWWIDEGNGYPQFYWETDTPPPPHFSGFGIGSSTSPFVISNVQELQEVNRNLTAHFVLGNDIDASQTSAWDNGAGFFPIGEPGSSFRGTFDGMGFKIINLSIHRPSMRWGGVFGYATGARIANVLVEDCSIVCSEYVGGLVGTNRQAVLTNITTIGSVSGSTRVGGVIGENDSGTIEDSASSADIAGDSMVGGLVGDSHGDSLVMTSFSSGTASGNSLIGGLVGYNRIGGTISNSYSTSIVYGKDEYAGGLVGSSGMGDVIHSYSVGAVTGNLYTGGLIARFAYGTVTSSFWDIDRSLQSTSAEGSGKTTPQMYQRDTYEEWDFGSVWWIDEGNDYPHFYWEDGSPPMPTPTPVPPFLNPGSDINLDNKVDELDLLILLEDWHKVSGP